MTLTLFNRKEKGMNQALALEGINGVKPVLAEVKSNHVGYYRKIMNPEFVDAWMEKIKDTHKLREFVYAIDAMAEIGDFEGFPSGRLLNNPDVYTKPHRGAIMFTNAAKLTKIQSLQGVQVGSRVEELISDFFTQGYLKIFNEFFTAFGMPYGAFTLDGTPYELILTRTYMAVPFYSTILLKDTKTEKEIFIPFLTDRLSA